MCSLLFFVFFWGAYHVVVGFAPNGVTPCFKSAQGAGEFKEDKEFKEVKEVKDDSPKFPNLPKFPNFFCLLCPFCRNILNKA